MVADDLRGHVFVCTTNACSIGVVGQEARPAEIAKLYIEQAVQQNVFGLDIPVDYLVFVQVLHGERSLVKESES